MAKGHPVITMQTQLRLPVAAEKLLPHQAPMLFVDSLVEREGDRACGLAKLPVEGVAFFEDRFLPEYFIELIAQATALAKGYDSLIAGEKMNDGMLAGVDSFTYYGGAVPGRTVKIVTEKTFEFGAVTLIHGDVWDGESLLATANIKVWEDLSGNETA